MGKTVGVYGCNSPYNSDTVANTVEGTVEGIVEGTVKGTVEAPRVAHYALADNRKEL